MLWGAVKNSGFFCAILAVHASTFGAAITVNFWRTLKLRMSLKKEQPLAFDSN